MKDRIVYLKDEGIVGRARHVEMGHLLVLEEVVHVQGGFEPSALAMQYLLGMKDDKIHTFFPVEYQPQFHDITNTVKRCKEKEMIGLEGHLPTWHDRIDQYS